MGGSAKEDLQCQIEELTAERNALERQLHELQSKPQRRGAIRAIAASLVVTLACVTFTSATIGVWAKRSVLNEKVWTKRVNPLGKDPAVHDALATWMTDQLMEVVEPEKLFAEVLPERGQILAVPLSNAVSGFVHDQIIRFMETETFAQIWNAASSNAHRQVVRVIRGQSQVVTGTDDAIVINFVPLINAMLAELTTVTPELFGKKITLPTLTVDDLPTTAQQRLSEALGLPVTDEFGVIQIDDDGALKNVQQIVQISIIVVWALVIVTIALIVGALWLSPNRRRTLLQLVAGLAIGMILIRKGAIIVNRQMLDMIMEPTVRAAADSIIGQFITPLIHTTTWILWALALVAALALITGPYEWASGLRPHIAAAGAIGVGIARQAGTRVSDEKTIKWLRANSSLLQVIGVITVAIILIFTSFGWFGTGVVLVLFAAFEFVMWWLGRSAEHLSPMSD